MSICANVLTFAFFLSTFHRSAIYQEGRVPKNGVQRVISLKLLLMAISNIFETRLTSARTHTFYSFHHPNPCMI